MSLLKDDLRFWLRRQPAWCDLRNWTGLGAAEVLRRWRVWPGILRTPPVATEPSEPGCPVELHVMCHRGDWLLAVWMLKSFFHFAGWRPPLVIHLQNALKPSAEAQLRRHFPQARVVRPQESKAAVTAHLIRHGLVRCLHWRHELGIMQKLLDVQVVAGGRRILGLDADILFFQKPAELIQAAVSQDEGFVFQQDHADCYSLDRKTAQQELQIDLAPRVNTGIVLRPAEALKLARVEELLAHPGLAWNSGHLEQTLQALCASEQRLARYLPATYALSMGREPLPEGLVCRHYAGPSRRWITCDGMRWLLRRTRLAG